LIFSRKKTSIEIYMVLTLIAQTFNIFINLAIAFLLFR
jgi:hypothetical protein